MERAVETPCPVCGEDDCRPRYPARGIRDGTPTVRGGVPESSHHPIVECLGCGVAYTRPRDPDGLSSAGDGSRLLADYLREERAKEALFRRQLERIEGLLGRRG